MNAHSRIPLAPRLRGFTLIELLVVIAIIGLLASVVLASLNTARLRARDATRRETLHSLQTALELYAASNSGAYPVSAGSSWVNDTAGANWIPGLAPTYIGIVPKDPVGNGAGSGSCGFGGGYAYYYISDGTAYKLVACSESQVSTSDGLYDSVRPIWGLQICSGTFSGGRLCTAT